MLVSTLHILSEEGITFSGKYYLSLIGWSSGEAGTSFTYGDSLNDDVFQEIKVRWPGRT